MIGAGLEHARRRGAIGAFRLASLMLRWAMMRHRQRRISHNRLRTVLSGTRWLERCGAWLALGRKPQRRHVEQEFTRDRID